MNISALRTSTPLHRQSTADDIKAQIGNLDDIQVFHNQVLVGIFIRPDQTASGLFLPDQVLNEDLYQGKAGLVLKKGPLAFKDDSASDFGGMDVQEGEWAIFRVSDGFSLKINGVMCRLLEDVHIKGTVANPISVY